MADDYAQALGELKGVCEEYLQFRESVIGKAPCGAREDIDAAVAERNAFRPLAMLSRMNGEARGVAAFDTLYHIGFFRDSEIIGEDVERMVPEFRFGRGRVDRAAFHRSGKLSLIEIKDNASPRDVVAGIGQVQFYAAMAERETPFSPIAPVLAVLGDHDEDVARACGRAGVQYLPLGGVKWWKTLSILIEAVVF